MFWNTPYNIGSNKIMLEHQKSQLESKLSRLQAEYTSAQNDLNMVNAQLKALDQPVAAPAPADPQAAIMGQLGQAFGVQGLTADQLQSAFASPDGQALGRLVADEIKSIVQRQAGGQAAPPN